MRICKLADHCCAIKSDRGFDIKVEMNENPILVKDIREWLLTRKVKDRCSNDFGTIENICLFKIYKWKWIISKHISKKGYKTLTEEVLPAVSKFGPCQSFSCKWHKEFLLTCSQCRHVRCSDCVMLKSSIRLLVKLVENDGWNYLQSFISDYSNSSDIGLKNFLI